MRFGVMAMQMDALIPSGLSPQDMLGYVATFDHAALVRDLHTQGFDLIELGGDLVMFMPQTYAPDTIERLGLLKEEIGVSYTVHLPLWSVEPSTPLTPVRHGSVRAVADVLRATLPLEPEAYVFHATGALAAEFYRMRLPEMGRALLLRQFQAGAMESLKALLDETGVDSRRLAIETIEFPLDLTLEMAERLDLSLCLDTGHVLSGFCGTSDLFAVLELCRSRLAEVHLHDSPAHTPGAEIVYGGDHSVLGTGALDTGRFLDQLSAMEFSGPLVFELKVDEALASLEVIRGLRPGVLAS